MSKEIKKLVLVVLSPETRVVKERWTFDVVLMEPEITADEGSVCVPPFLLFPITSLPSWNTNPHSIH